MTNVGQGKTANPVRAKAREKLIQTAYEAFDKRVEGAVRSRLSVSERVQYDSFFAEGDVAGGFEWLRRVLPDYDRIVAAETTRLRADVTEAAYGNEL